MNNEFLTKPRKVQAIQITQETTDEEIRDFFHEFEQWNRISFARGIHIAAAGQYFAKFKDGLVPIRWGEWLIKEAGMLMSVIPNQSFLDCYTERKQG